MDRIAFVTTCKNRLHHLQQTLPLWVAEAPDEIVVVDYGCPQGTGDWVEANWPQVKVVRVTDDPGFCLSRARNLGAAAADAEWVCFIDADILVRAGWVAWMRAHLRRGGVYRAGAVGKRRQTETSGTAVLERAAWRAVGEYDELFTGWGGEDTDLYDRLQLAGVEQRDYPPDFVEAITHDDTARFAYSTFKTRDDSLRFQNLYRFAKYVWMAVGGVEGDLSREQREHLRGLVVAAFNAQDGDARTVWPEVSIDVGELGAWLPEARRAGASCRCTLRIESPPRFRRMRKRVTRWWRGIRSLFVGRSKSHWAPTVFDLERLLVTPVSEAVRRADLAEAVRAEQATILYSRPSYQPVKVFCSYDIPAAAQKVATPSSA